MAEVITFAHHKGGTGKTTSCISVAGYLAIAGKRVLVVDLDPQANATAGLGVVKKAGYTMYHVMDKKLPMSKVILGTNHENIHLAPSNSNLIKSDLRVYNSRNDAKILRNALKEIESYYEYILIDTPPSNAHFLINALVAADNVMVVLDTGIFALEGIESLNKFFRETNKRYGSKIKIDDVLLTKCKNSIIPFLKDDATEEIQEEIIKRFKDRFYSVPYSDIIYKTHKEGIPISHYKPRSKVGRMYEKVAESFM